ncbi:MAG: EAL domain-containing protein, partial [Pseudomonadota bacterium]
DEAGFEVLGDVAANIVAAVKQGEQKSRGRPVIDLSIGIAMSDGSAASIARLYTQADAAAFAAKEAMGSNVVTYDAKLKSAILRKTNVETRLRTALTRGDINIAFQPQFRLKGAEMIGFEALARWSDPKLGIVGPDEFVGVAEESALIHDFDRMIARKSLKSAALWLAKNQTISINVSGHTVVSADYCRFLIQEIANSGLSPQQVEIEITETALIENWETCRRNIDRMRKEGIRIVLDDFGIGYSSLSYLSQFPVQKIKFDRTFLLQCRSASNTKVMHTIVQLAKVLDVEVIAEGVETNRHVALLKHIGCPYAQGYLFAKPIAATKMHEFFRSRAVKTLLDASDTGTFEPIENMVA